MQKIFVLEDSLERIKFFLHKFPSCVIHSNPNDFVNAVKDFHYSRMVNDKAILFLDHDLEFFEFAPYKTEITGTHVCQALIEINGLNKSIDEIIIHSMNASKQSVMRNILQDGFFERVIIIPFNNLT